MSSCGKISDPVLRSSEKDIRDFRIEAKNNPSLSEDIVCDIVEDRRILCVIPLALDSQSIVASFTSHGASVHVKQIEQISGQTPNNFQRILTYTVFAEDQSSQQYSVIVHQQPAGLPILTIETSGEAPIISKDDYLDAHLSIAPNEKLKDASFEGDIQIRGRGNSTWTMPKNPYRIKLAEKSELLGMPADKDWVLLANYSDKSLIRNYLAFETSKIFGLPYTPRSEFVELYLNGAYQGLYQLTEAIKISPDRVDIQKLKEKDVDADKISGGYLLEADYRLDADVWFISSQNIHFTIKDPDDGIDAQSQYIQNYIQQTEDALYSQDFADPVQGYAAFLNPETLVNWFWVNELFKNNDATFFSSVYLYKDRDAKLNLGPVWDFDIAAGNINYNGNDNPEGWWIKNSVWIARLFEDPAFSGQAIARWKEVKSELIKTLAAKTQDITTYLEDAQANNFKAWDILDSYVWPNAVVTGSYDGEIEYLSTWLDHRIHWIDSHILELAL